tara:strand:- start:1023 stop:2012 length:990 start_codon:yes stop_codon:yes gene_type:complete
MSDTDKSLEQLLGKATRRPVPDEAHVTEAREALRAEWKRVTGRQQSRRRILHYAVAATVLVTVFSLFNSLRQPIPDRVQVASIQKSFGSIYFVSDQSVMTPADSEQSIHLGETISTGRDAGIALAWLSGGSLRLDENTTVEFRDDRTIFLRSGQVYFDSIPSSLIVDARAAEPGSLAIETDYGRVTHVGTQFIVGVDDRTLQVSVREGQVDVAGRYYQRVAERGQQLRFAGRQQPALLSIDEYGEAWNWVAERSPAVEVDGRTVDEFLGWVGRELGREIEYSDDAKSLTGERLLGSVDDDPMEALRMHMLTTGLVAEFGEGVIHVRTSN